jgi:hypothetical protein
MRTKGWRKSRPQRSGMMSEQKKVTLAEHVADTHREKTRPGNVVTGDIVGGDVVDEEEEESTDAPEEEEGSGEDS